MKHMQVAVITVGELITALQKFDHTLPVLKSDACGISYLPVDLLENQVFPVRRNCYSNGVDEFLDADPADKNFDAVVL